MTLKHEQLPKIEGKVWRRKSDGMMTEESLLGYTYYLGGVKLDEPHWETAEDYELIDAPVEETTEEGETIINEE
ncbi:MAG: hypothetical protein IJF63_04980 [Alistipes sp.]|nr:hypothetical protein [Alistipes sp.]MBQ6862272.1 hypothetical protein [Alistipes sp.]